MVIVTTKWRRRHGTCFPCIYATCSNPKSREDRGATPLPTLHSCDALHRQGITRAWYINLARRPTHRRRDPRTFRAGWPQRIIAQSRIPSWSLADNSLLISLASPPPSAFCFLCCRGEEMKEMMVGSAAPVGPVGRWGAAPPQALLERMKDYGQEGAFALWDELSPEDRDLLVRDIEVSPMSPRSRLFGDQDFARSRRGVKIWSCIARWNCRQRFWFEFFFSFCISVSASG
jgi:hypothetical protein